MNKTHLTFGSLSPFPVSISYDIHTAVEPEHYFAVNFTKMEIVDLGMCLHHAQAVHRAGEAKEATGQDVRSSLSAKEWKEMTKRNPMIPVPVGPDMTYFYDIVWDSMKQAPRIVRQAFPPTNTLH